MSSTGCEQRTPSPLLADETLQRDRLGRYFSPQVAAHIQQAGLGLATGEQCEVTVLFADLRQFTALSERLAPTETVVLLNEFHARMVAAVFEHQGTLDKFLGDGLMAYFGAPMTQTDHPLRALRCAVAMQAALAELNAARTARNQPALRMGVGLHTGTAVVGVIGTETRRPKPTASRSPAPPPPDPETRPWPASSRRGAPPR